MTTIDYALLKSLMQQWARTEMRARERYERDVTGNPEYSAKYAIKKAKKEKK
jgi:hypothetical protein